MLILLPPSESKKTGGIDGSINLSHSTPLPYDLATSVTDSQLKCKGARLAEARELNQHIADHTVDSIAQEVFSVMPAYERYTGVMYKAIDIPTFSPSQLDRYRSHICILSGLYGIVRPGDMIANYKLPITTQLTHYWRPTVTERINIWAHEAATSSGSEPVILDLLSGAYRKMVDREYVTARVERPAFLKSDGTPYTHGVKKVKGEWIRERCK